MSQELATFSPSEEQIELIKRTVAKGATNDELQMFLHQCKKMGVDPIMNQMYFIKRADKVNVQVGIGGLRAIASRQGDYDGQDPITYGPDFKYKTAMVPEWAEAKIFKKGISRPFTHRVYWTEFVPASNDFMWLKMPKNQLGKCAEAAAFRKGWPDYQVYLADEMEQGDDPQSRSQIESRSAEVETNAFNEPLATPAQIKRIYTIATSKGITRELVHQGIEKSYNVKSTKELTRDQIEELAMRLNRAPARETVHIESDDPEIQAEVAALEGDIVATDLNNPNL